MQLFSLDVIVLVELNVDYKIHFDEIDKPFKNSENKHFYCDKRNFSLAKTSPL